MEVARQSSAVYMESPMNSYMLTHVTCATDRGRHFDRSFPKYSPQTKCTGYSGVIGKKWQDMTMQPLRQVSLLKGKLFSIQWDKQDK